MGIHHWGRTKMASDSHLQDDREKNPNQTKVKAKTEMADDSTTVHALTHSTEQSSNGSPQAERPRYGYSTTASVPKLGKSISSQQTTFVAFRRKDNQESESCMSLVAARGRVGLLHTMWTTPFCIITDKSMVKFPPVTPN